MVVRKAKRLILQAQALRGDWGGGGGSEEEGRCQTRWEPAGGHERFGVVPDAIMIPLQQFESL